MIFIFKITNCFILLVTFIFLHSLWQKLEKVEWSCH